ncbi:hypothetical protein ACFQH6_17135 [Halobacteriaceae archaeon GCM10025711]
MYRTVVTPAASVAVRDPVGVDGAALDGTTEASSRTDTARNQCRPTRLRPLTGPSPRAAGDLSRRSMRPARGDGGRPSTGAAGP